MTMNTFGAQGETNLPEDLAVDHGYDDERENDGESDGEYGCHESETVPRNAGVAEDIFFGRRRERDVEIPAQRVRDPEYKGDHPRDGTQYGGLAFAARCEVADRVERGSMSVEADDDDAGHGDAESGVVETAVQLAERSVGKVDVDEAGDHDEPDEEITDREIDEERVVVSAQLLVRGESGEGKDVEKDDEDDIHDVQDQTEQSRPWLGHWWTVWWTAWWTTRWTAWWANRRS